MHVPTIDFNPLFLRAMERIDAGSHVFVTGRAGTGKSTLLQHVRRHRDHAVVLAPTGVAAVNVRGQTLHSFFGFKPDISPHAVARLTPRDPELYKKLTTLIIDEVSMVRADLLDCVDQFLRRYGPTPGTPFGGVQLVLFGDLHQLPPVVARDEAELFQTTYESPFFFSAVAMRDVRLDVVELETVYRQKDARFIALLNAIRDRSASSDDIAALNARVGVTHDDAGVDVPVWLTATNAQADTINVERIASLSGETWSSTADVLGDFERSAFPTATTLELKVGAHVMLLNNDTDGRWVNGTMGVVEEFLPESNTLDERIAVRLETGQRVDVERHTWELFRTVLRDGHLESESIGSFTQFPLRLGFAITIHKSQGKTFNRVVLDLGRGAFAHGQLYVALSRCTTLEGLALVTPIRPQDLRVDPMVAHFAMRHLQHNAPAPACSASVGEAASPVRGARATTVSHRNLDDGEKVSRLHRAIDQHERLEITYQKERGEPSRRVIEPRRFVKLGAVSHPTLGVEAFCLMRDDLRVFAVSRILALEVVERSPRRERK